MRNTTELTIWGAVVITSLALHAIAFGGLAGRGDGPGQVRRARAAALVEMSVKPKEALPSPPKAEKPAPRIATARPVRVRAAPPPSSAPPPAPESPADFTGVTMTNDGPGAGWSSATGNGDSMRGPVGRPGARITRRVVDGDGTDIVRHAGPPIAAAADLSRPPVAPELAPALARAYPPQARAKGVTGRALVHARIMPDGHVGELKLISESEPGFGAACLTTLRASLWSAPLDRQSRPVSTYVNYTCRFEVQ